LLSIDGSDVEKSFSASSKPLDTMPARIYDEEDEKPCGPGHDKKGDDDDEDDAEDTLIK
jgi:hypothetical protein